MDLDGWPDLLIVNGHVYPEADRAGGRYAYAQPKLLYRGRGDGRFEDVSLQAGPGLALPRRARRRLRRPVQPRPPGRAREQHERRAHAAARLRARRRPPRAPPRRHALEPQRDRGPRDRAGRRAPPDRRGAQRRKLLLPERPAPALRAGPAAAPDRIEVAWPSGARESLANVPAGQTVILREGAGVVGARPFRDFRSPACLTGRKVDGLLPPGRQEMKRRRFVRSALLAGAGAAVPGAARAAPARKLIVPTDTPDRHHLKVMAFNPIPAPDPATWELAIGGLVAAPQRLKVADLARMPRLTQSSRLKCVQCWSGRVLWEGFRAGELLKLARPKPEATWVRGLAAFYLALPQTPSTPRETSPSHLAETIWEQGIAAKGGREALFNVRNLVVSARGDYSSRRLKKNEVRQEVLYVLPDKFWAWTDYRPDVFGLRVEMYNYENSTKYVISEGEPNRQLEPIDEKDRKTRDLLWALLPYLPETKWLKPVLVGVQVGRVGKQTVDILETTVKGRRVDFAFDRQTHLPIRVSYYSTHRNKTYVTPIDLADYVEVGGIKLPQTLKHYDGTRNEERYQLNVGYNEDIFSKPTHIEAGPKAWKDQN